MKDSECESYIIYFININRLERVHSQKEPLIVSLHLYDQCL